MKNLIVLTLFILATAFVVDQDFIAAQKKNARVKTAYTNKFELVKSNLKKHDISLDKLQMLIVAYKQESVFKIYAKEKSDVSYKEIANYKICAKSGTLGPKRKEGDGQVPEGFYLVDRYNPGSNYYLSLGINYPNAADKLRNGKVRLGGDIFIHGECVTIGCMPMTNDKIEEIYLYAIQAKAAGQNQIPVYVFPFEMTEQNLTKYKKEFADDKSTINFWNNIKLGYDKFMQTKVALNVSVNKAGDYVFK